MTIEANCTFHDLNTSTLYGLIIVLITDTDHQLHTGKYSFQVTQFSSLLFFFSIFFALIFKVTTFDTYAMYFNAEIERANSTNR